jgi:hypothetical protein
MPASRENVGDSERRRQSEPLQKVFAFRTAPRHDSPLVLSDGLSSAKPHLITNVGTETHVFPFQKVGSGVRVQAGCPNLDGPDELPRKHHSSSRLS